MKNLSKNFKSNLGILGFILVDLYLIAFSNSTMKIALGSISLVIFIRLLSASKNKSN
jgi:hypothetical protein